MLSQSVVDQEMMPRAKGMLGVPTFSALSLGLLPEVNASAIGLPEILPGVLARVTVEFVARLFPATQVAHLEANLPCVIEALKAAGLTDAPMVLAALGTIRAEAETFAPLCEQPSVFNTSSGGHAFDLYDRKPGLGNQGAPDGARFCGRGFVQLTGRANYEQYGALTGLDLVNHPELACEAGPAATLLARFLADRQDRIRKAIASGNMAQARRLVNGGTNGLARFAAVVEGGMKLLA